MITNEYGIESAQHALLDLIKRFDSFCRNNDIAYSLYGGSCLGAIRHQGFIPWDDDLDVCVTRETYDRLIGMLSACGFFSITEELWIYRIRDRETKSANEYSPTLDIFVVDSAPDCKPLFAAKTLTLKILQGMMKEAVAIDTYPLTYRIPLLVTKLIGRPFPIETKQRWYDLVSRIGKGSSTHISNTLFRHITKRYPAYIWNSVEYVPFEDTQLPVLKQYDTLLTILYGDYMTLPPRESRIPAHISQ